MRKMEELIYSFIRESNHIEGIDRPPLPVELREFGFFLRLPMVGVITLSHLVSVFQPGAKLRQHSGMDVQVGNHLPPIGGPLIPLQLESILSGVSGMEPPSPYLTHLAYETLHPYMDGNGRSGRALWAWQMVNAHGWKGLELGFLHSFYYQTLGEHR